MNAVALPFEDTAALGHTAAAASVRLSGFRPGQGGTVARVGTDNAPLTALERRLMELGFIAGESVDVLAEARPGRDPFVVRVGGTTLALRRREVDSVWVSTRPE